jgi:hypothetical protein
MEVSNIIYYTRQNNKSKTLSLRNLCIKEAYDNGLETIFYAVRDSGDTNQLLEMLNKICYEQITFESETPSYIRFSVVDAYDSTNYLKFKKRKIYG